MSEKKEKVGPVIDRTALGVGPRYEGKVRDVYDLGDRLLFVSTDRLSAFDRHISSIPHKGRVLNLVSKWWFDRTAHIVPNHVISIPHPSVTVGKKCTVFPIEFVVRGYITGTSGTSLWTHYNKGVREYCGIRFPDGLKRDQKLEKNILTPTTKSDVHDELISAKEIIEQGIMTAEDFGYCEQKSLELFEFGQRVAEEHGLILVDTKYEFGKDAQGNITLIDEIHTPDSSRYWIAETYQPRYDAGEAPQSVDKDIVRRWYAEKCDPYKDQVLPQAPVSLINTLSERYIYLFEKITGEKFPAGAVDEQSVAGLNAQLRAAGLLPRTKKVVIIMGSPTDWTWAEAIARSLKKLHLSYELHAASAHKEPLKVLEIIQTNEKNKYENGQYSHFVVYITIAGRSNALSGFVAGNSTFPTLACPPFKDKMDMLVNIHSTLQMPSNVPSLTVLEPDNAAQAAKRILDFAGFWCG